MDHFQETALSYPEELRATKPDSKAFSATEIVYHMLRVEMTWQARFEKLLAGNKAPFAALDPDRDASEGRYNLRNYKDGLEMLQNARQETIETLKPITAEQMSLTGTHPKYGEMSIADILAKIESHDRGHADQLGRTLEALKQAA